ncbi:PREDICTED: uncharacterized protein LOC104727984 [Camelina sativa]|uniref:Uncharacterized protein LOC104727984 n=1 Tax=Camelina sativa TaxID=90675 RepID=A0ABM1QKX0_CAMSA|nr:PREDICTED: uncharacterized protein LOC104727984 [Camelina sativa]
MENFSSVVEEPGYSDSLSPISEPPDIRNWFPSYVYESVPSCSSINDIENEVVVVKQWQISDHSESLPSEPPDVRNWFPSYVYESPLLDTSDGFELSLPGESVCIKETETGIERTDVCPRLFEQELVSSSTKADDLVSLQDTDFSQSLSFISEPPDVRNWFPSYEYQSPQLSLSDTHDELGFSSFEKDELIVDESDTEDRNGSGIFRKIKSKQKTVGLGRLNSNDYYKDTIATETAKEVSSDNAYSDQEMEKQFSVRLFNASEKEVKPKSSFEQEPLCCEPKEEAKINPEVSRYNQKRKSPSKNESSLHELRPNHIQETISMNSNRQKSSIEQESDDKENVHHGQSTEAGFVATKKARFKEARGHRSMMKPNTRVQVECSRSKELKNIAEEERKKKRRVLGEMSNHQFSSGAEEIAGKWRCPQKNKRNIVPPLKQLRLDAWIHKV